MATTHRTYTCRLANHTQVKEALDRHAWSASKLWNVANHYARQVWDETGEIPGESDLKRELKDHPKYKGLHSQSSQKVLEELSEAYSSWFNSAGTSANPPGYRKKNYYDAAGNVVHEEHPRSTVTWKASAIWHDAANNRLRLSKGANHKSSPRAREYILAEYEGPPDITLSAIQQVRAVWDARATRWELHVVCEEEIAAHSPGDSVAGVDLGICNPAAVALPGESLVYPGNRLHEDQEYFQRAEFQTEGEHGPSETAWWAREKLARRRDHFLHALTKDIVERCVAQEVGTLVVGDPRRSREADSDEGSQGDWPYKRILTLLDYKARAEGIEVERRGERGTSTQCSVCGFTDPASRIERGLWKCGQCSVVAHADVNAAANIRHQNVTVTPRSEDSGNGCLAQPRIIRFDRTRGFEPRNSVGDV